jgi:hypothetical protein
MSKVRIHLSLQSMALLRENFRTLLVLGRISNLPTVWSNLLAGASLAGVREWLLFATLIPLLLGGSFLYIGGMYLNDFCDASFDARHCPGRPIPSGKISQRTVGILAGLWFIAGLTFLILCGLATFLIGLLLSVVIIIYDYWHKDVSCAPLIMGLCRLLLYPLAASIFASGPLPLSNSTLGLILGVVPVAVPLALYVAGITYLARGESRPGKPTRWALVLLALPVVFAGSTFLERNLPGKLLLAVLICLVQLSWMAWLLTPLLRQTRPSIGRVVSGLLAGIVLVDMIALVPLGGSLATALFALFILALLLQRIIPAT